MTNGEKLKEIFPSIIKYGNILIDDTGALQKNILFDDTWWNAEYQEPSSSEIPKNSPTETLVSLDVYKQVAKERDIAIEQLHELGYEFGQKIELTTNNCESCKYYGSHHEVCNYCYKCSLWTVKEPTTKKDLGVDKTFYERIMEYCKEHFLVLVDKDVWEDAEKALTTKNDLGVDWKELKRKILMEVDGGTDDAWLACGEVCNRISNSIDEYVQNIKAMPSVTPQEPKCKDCKWWKDSDGKYRRGCGAESQCPINCKEVFEGNGYCFLFAPQESEET